MRHRSGRQPRGGESFQGAMSWPSQGAVLWLALLFSQAAGAASAGGERLLESINAYRASEHVCEAKRSAALPPLTLDPALAVSSDSRSGLQGTTYASIKTVALRGPSTAEDVFAVLVRDRCAVLGNPAYGAMFATRPAPDEWRIAFAQPLLSPNLGDWRAAGEAVLALVNRARATSRRCGDERFSAAAPLSWSDALGRAALAHSREMAATDRFSHAGKNNSNVGERAARQNYRWRRIGENIAAGQGSAAAVVAGWLASPEHCANIMNPYFRDSGAAFATNPGSAVTIFWTQVFGAKQQAASPTTN